MQYFFFTVLALFLLILLTSNVYLIKKLGKNKKNPEENDQLLAFLQNQLNRQSESMETLRKTLDQKISENNQVLSQNQKDLQATLQNQFGHNTRIIQNISGQSNKMIAEITEKLTHLDKTNQQVMSFSSQLNDLEKTLTHQKKRGNLGEAGLELVLDNMLPATAYQKQYKFSDGNIVDAIIRTKEGIIPIDAKFSLENYERIQNEKNEKEKDRLQKEFKNDLKKRIEETSKYIKPEEGTLNFAFMFIPAEGIYYDLLVNEVGSVKVDTRSLIEYAMKEKKVIIVSPTTFAAYLQTVLQGLRAMQVEESAKEIQKHVEKLAKHIGIYENYMKKLGGSMSTTVNHYNNAYKELGKIDKDIIKITSGEKQVESIEIDRPILE